MNMNHSTNIASDTTLPVLTVKDGHPVTTSLDVAKVFGKQHKDVLRSIREVELPDDFTERNFALSGYTDMTGRKLPCYDMTRDGFTFLVMGFTGKEANLWKMRYIEAFNAMEAELLKQKEHSNTEALARVLQEHEDLKTALHEIQEGIRQMGDLRAVPDEDAYMTVRDFCQQEEIFAPRLVARHLGMMASDRCRSLNLRIMRIADERWNWINSYPVVVLRACIADHAQQRCGNFKQG